MVLKCLLWVRQWPMSQLLGAPLSPRLDLTAAPMLTWHALLAPRGRVRGLGKPLTRLLGSPRASEGATISTSLPSPALSPVHPGAARLAGGDPGRGDALGEEGR